MGDRIAATWNASKPCINHRVMAVTAALDTAKLAGHTVALPISIGIATGDALCGNFGTESLLRYNIVGAVFGYAHDLEKMARDWNIGVLVDSRVQRDVSSSHRLRVVMERLRYPKSLSNELAVVWQVVDVNGPRGEEWMYVVASNRMQMSNAVNDVAILFLKGQVAEARAKLDTLRQTDDYRTDPQAAHVDACVRSQAALVAPVCVPVPTPASFPCFELTPEPELCRQVSRVSTLAPHDRISSEVFFPLSNSIASPERPSDSLHASSTSDGTRRSLFVSPL
ncbi:hypothetical protein DIPPA_22605 [Diplonema papillatum]|nr:hypothetical protein DIPPA_22605 [Diplonema papillatum]